MKICDCFCFDLLRPVIGPETHVKRHPLNYQLDAQLKPISTGSPAFSRALSSLTLSCHWLTNDDVTFILIGQCDNPAFGIWTFS